MKINRIKITPMAASIPQGGLTGLDKVILCPRYAAMLEAALKCSTGPAWWRHRKAAEAHDLLALAQICGRAVVRELDLTESIRAIIQARFPVPRMPEGGNTIQVVPEVILAVKYSEAAARLPQPGFAYVQILYPDRVWLANVASDHGQPLCLGTTLPAGIPLREIVLLAYGALTMQTTMFDERDSAGVLQPQSAIWWQQNLSLIPLSRESFICPAAQA